MNVLVTGGAGYIGSHMVNLLCQQGHQVVTLDNLSNGHRDSIRCGTFVEADLGDTDVLNDLFARHAFDAVVHFAGYIEVAESVNNPGLYYSVNVSNTLGLLNTMLKHGVTRFIFSSTAAIFGEPQSTPIDESHVTAPLNPYGKSKLMVEQILADFDRAFGLKHISLRYFNAAGGDSENGLGERHDPETHLIPLVLQVASGRREHILVFGDDYPTDDGTCVRDFVHVLDLCHAHLLALQALIDGCDSDSFNLGNGQGFSVKQVIELSRRVTGRQITALPANRRAGDPAILVADSSKAKAVLGWRPRYQNLERIIEDAWNWELSLLSNQ